MAAEKCALMGLGYPFSYSLVLTREPKKEKGQKGTSKEPSGGQLFMSDLFFLLSATLDSKVALQTALVLHTSHALADSFKDTCSTEDRNSNYTDHRNLKSVASPIEASTTASSSRSSRYVQICVRALGAKP